MCDFSSCTQENQWPTSVIVQYFTYKFLFCLFVCCVSLFRRENGFKNIPIRVNKSAWLFMALYDFSGKFTFCVWRGISGYHKHIFLFLTQKHSNPYTKVQQLSYYRSPNEWKLSSNTYCTNCRGVDYQVENRFL